MSRQIVLQFSTCEHTLKNWTSAIIRRLCHSPFSHVDFVLGDGSLLGASDQGHDSPVIKGNSCGVAIRPPDYQPFGYRRRMTIVTDKAESVLAAAYSQLGKAFDSEALHDFLGDEFPGIRDWRDPDKWFCAELVAWAFETGGYWIPSTLQWPKNRVSPTDMLLVLQFDANWVNRDVFWEPVPGLKLGLKEV